MSEQRLKYLDLASGIMIVWLLLYHALYPMVGDNISGKIPFFYYFMPWFFYKSGMMFHPKSFSDLLKKDYNKLIRTFLIWSLVGYVVYVFWHQLVLHDLSWRIALYCPIRSLILGGSIPMNTALWFLPVLFIVRQITNYGISKLSSLWMALGWLIITSIVLLIHSRFLPSWFVSTCWGAFFFCCGYYFKNKEDKWWIILPASCVFIFSFFTDIPSVYSDDSPRWLMFMIWLPTCVCACITFNNICKCITKFWTFICHEKCFFPILTYVGKNSMVYYAGHYIIFKIGFDIIDRVKAEWYNSWQGLCIVLICYAVILTLILCIITYFKNIKKYE